MPNKYPNKKGWHVPKQKYKVSNWAEYNDALRRRGSIEIWIADDIMDSWTEKERVYDGTGAPKKFTDFAILVCHEVRQVFRLRLRQSQGFINSMFQAKNLTLESPDYSCLSKRLSALLIQSPRYKKPMLQMKPLKALHWMQRD